MTTSSLPTSSSTSLVVSIGSSTQADGSVVPVTLTSITVVQATGSASDNSSSSSSASNGAVIGGAVGGVVGGLALLLAAFLIFFLVRRRKARTGHGWFLCFGSRPDENDNDIFDPSEGAHATGGRNGRNNVGATLPQGFEDEDPEAYANDMEEYNHSVGTGVGSAAAGAGAGGAAGYYGSSYNDHQSNNGANGGQNSSNHDYSHFDPPEVRAARAREAAEAAASARATSASNHPNILVPGSSVNGTHRTNSFGQSDGHSFNGGNNAVAGSSAAPPAYADAQEPAPNSREAAVLDDDDDGGYGGGRIPLGIANPDNDEQSSVVHNHRMNKDLPPTSTSRRD